tara:strand:- start:26 stop:529 length:504 start_codon:yes stop_codon:yes gene_type:complete
MIFNKNLKLLLSLMFLLVSCGELDFVYENPKNKFSPLTNKTSFIFEGKDLPSIIRFSSKYFGQSKNPDYELIINVEETKIKKSVQKNQAISKLDYELSFNYALNTVDGCEIYSKQISSRFSYTPKSSGYNFGSDQSLENKYNLAIDENFSRFADLIEEIDLVCKNEN